MTFGAEFVKAIAKYLSKFEGRKLQSVAGVSSFCVLTLGKNQNLLLSFENANAGVAILTEEEKKFLLSQSDFLPPIVNAIKSHLIGSTFTSFEQINNDKVLAVNFERQIGANFKTHITLILELESRHTNLLLLAEDGKIIEAARHFTPEENALRTILPRLPYVTPPSMKGIALADWIASTENLTSVLGFGKPFLKFLATLGLPRAKEILSSFDESDFVSFSLGNYTAVLPSSCPLPTEVETFAMEVAMHRVFEDFATRVVQAKRKKLLKAIDKEVTRREKQLADIRSLLTETKGEKFKLWADLITANLWQIDSHGQGEVTLTQYNDDGTTSEVSVPLDVTKSASATAEAYYKKYKKLRASKERASVLLATVEAEKSDLETERAIAETLTTADELDILASELGVASTPRKKKNTEEQLPYRKITYDDAIIFLGLSAKGNRIVTFKLAIPSDTWFHAEGVPGSHVLLRIATTVTQERLEELRAECASLASRYSKARGEAGTRVDFCQRKYVTAIQGGVANVTYRNFETIKTGKP